MTGLSVTELCKILRYPKDKYQDSRDIVKAVLKYAAQKAAVQGFDGFKLWESDRLIILTMYRESINIGLVQGYEIQDSRKRARQKGRWKLIEGMTTQFKTLHPEDYAKELFGDDKYCFEEFKF